MDELSEKLYVVIAELQRIRQQAEPIREILDATGAAEYLGQSEYTIREWVRMRKIPYFKVNGSIKFRKSRLDRWIDRGEVLVLE